jgi:hypothetical protein
MSRVAICDSDLCGAKNISAFYGAAASLLRTDSFFINLSRVEYDLQHLLTKPASRRVNERQGEDPLF